jgi:hypothetical protein
VPDPAPEPGAFSLVTIHVQSAFGDVSRAKVQLRGVGLKLNGTTDARGLISFDDVPAGMYLVKFSYKALRGTAILTVDEPTEDLSFTFADLLSERLRSSVKLRHFGD